MKPLSYGRYPFSIAMKLLLFAGAFALYLSVSLLLYNSFRPLVAFPLFLFWFQREMDTLFTEKRINRLREDFLRAMEAFVTALRAGYAQESAVRECLRDMNRLLGEEADMVQELKLMTLKLGVNTPVEVLFQDLAHRCEVAEIATFAAILGIGKRSGGPVTELLERTLMQLRQQLETRRDMEAEAAARKTEYRIMCVIPWVILLYLRVFSGEYVAVLYEGIAGPAAASISLCVYLAAFYAGRKATRLQW